MTQPTSSLDALTPHADQTPPSRTRADDRAAPDPVGEDARTAAAEALRRADEAPSAAVMSLRSAATEAVRDGNVRSGKPKDLIRQYELVERVSDYDPDVDEDLLNRAYVLAMRAHANQKRSSGDPYISHPLAVAGILAELRLDTATVATGLLHDVVEDTEYTIGDIEEAFGSEIASLVDGVTKISVRELSPDRDQKAANFEKFILATAKDIRVLLVKLADRLHNMRTLHYIPKPEKRTRIAQETMEIYAPMSARIGLGMVREELEDLSFRYLDPAAYDSISVGLENLGRAPIKDVVALAQILREELQKTKMKFEVHSREKRAYSIWRKMQRKGHTFDELADIYAFRVIVEEPGDCYRALGVIHTAFPMIPEEFDDYISRPKQNGYQSIHTAVIAPGLGGGGQRVEIQIRTREMDDVAERGLAAHWRYKQLTNEGGADRQTRDTQSIRNWLQTVIDTLGSEEGKKEGFAQAKIDLYHDQIFAFTPKGRVIPLPTGATALDFAYAVHTGVGDRFAAAKVNGVQRPARYRLRNGDVAEILKSENAPIPEGWQDFVVTGGAKAGLRKRQRLLAESESAELGERMLAAAFAAKGLQRSDWQLQRAATKLGYEDVAGLFRAVSTFQQSREHVVAACYPDLDRQPEDADKVPLSPTDPVRAGERLKTGAVSIGGLVPGGAIRLGACCNPLPGERILGVKGGATERALMVHRIDCKALAAVEDAEWVSLQWREEAGPTFVTPIEVTIVNRIGALAQITAILARYGVDVVDLRVRRRAVDFNELSFDVIIRDARHLASVLTALRGSDFVVEARRWEERACA